MPRAFAAAAPLTRRGLSLAAALRAVVASRPSGFRFADARAVRSFLRARDRVAARRAACWRGGGL